MEILSIHLALDKPGVRFELFDQQANPDSNNTWKGSRRAHKTVKPESEDNDEQPSKQQIQHALVHYVHLLFY